MLTHSKFSRVYCERFYKCRDILGIWVVTEIKMTFVTKHKKYFGYFPRMLEHTRDC